LKNLIREHKDVEISWKKRRSLWKHHIFNEESPGQSLEIVFKKPCWRNSSENILRESITEKNSWRIFEPFTCEILECWIV